jgi:nucleoside-diphosphate-sugar epimerase
VRVLVTGATGFIGRHVVAELRERGDEPVALARSSSNLVGLEGVEIARGDMTRPETLEAAVDGADAVIHLAALLKAPWRADFSSTNVEGAANVARACAAAARAPVLVVVSSLAAAGPAPPGELRDETMPPIPVSRYGRAKLAAERAARRAGRGVPITVVRPPMVLGEHDRGSLPLFRAAARGVAVAPVRARCEVSVVHARDLARALVAAAERGERVDDLGGDGTGVYYAPATEAIDFLELGRAVGRALGRRVLGLRLPAAATWVANAAAEVAGRLTDRPGLLSLDKHREATAGSWVCSGAKLRDHLDWSPEPLEQRLEETAAWYRSAGWL